VAFTYSFQFGSAGSGNGQFIEPEGVTSDSQGNIYVADSYNDRIEEFSNNGTFITAFGSVGSGDGQFTDPWGITLDSQGNIYVVDSGNDRIEKFSNNGTFITTFGSVGSGDGQFNDPQDITLDSQGNIYVTDNGNNRIEKFSNNGTFIAAFGHPGIGTLYNPTGITSDSEGNIYVTDGDIEEFSNNGTFIKAFGSVGSGDGQLLAPRGITLDSQGNIYVADWGNSRIEELSNNGTFITTFGEQQLTTPTHITLDSQGNIYVVDNSDNINVFTSNHTSRRASLLTLANLSNNVYSAQNPSYTDPKGNDGTYKYVPNNSAALSQTSNSFKAAEYQNGNQIVIVFRGSDNIDNYLNDASFLSTTPTQGLINYVNDAVAFLQSVSDNNPGDTITLAGHSLGGAIAQLLGEKTGLTTDVFNAPGAQQLYEPLLNTSTLRDLQQISNDNENNNYRIQDDQVSLAGTPIGIQTTLPAPPDNSDNLNTLTNADLLALGAKALVNFASTLANDHSINTVINQISGLEDGSVNPVSDPGINLTSFVQEIINQVTTTVTATGTAIGQEISNLGYQINALYNTPYIIDPSNGSDFVLTEAANSPNFASIDLPTFSGVNSYNVRYESNNTWSSFQTIQPGVTDTLAANVNSIEFQPLDANNNITTMSNAFDFGLTFSSNGTFNGTLTATQPTPTTDPSIIVNNQTYDYNENQTLTITPNIGVLNNDSDANEDSLTAVLVSQPSNGTITLNSDGSFNYIPNTGYIGTDSFTYEADNGSNLSTPATVTIVNQQQANSSNTTDPVYRFYDAATNQHFYTANTSEKDSLIANPSSGYSYEGQAFKDSLTAGAGLIPLYRFYSATSSDHFFTTNETEKNQIINTPSEGYNFEGVAFYVLGADATVDSNIYRFYNSQIGQHLFTGNTTEIASLPSSWVSEGVAFKAAF